MSTFLLTQDYVGQGDFYFMDAPGDGYQLAARALLHSTNGRVFLATADKPRLELWAGTIASSAGSTTVHYTTAATNGYISVEGTIRNSNEDGTAIRIWGASSKIYIYEAGAVIAKGSKSAGITLSVNSASTSATIENNGVISGNNAIVHSGTESVKLINNGRLDILSGSSYVDLYGAVDVIYNHGSIRGTIKLGGGSDSYFGQDGKLSGGINGEAGSDNIHGGVNDEYIDGGADIDNIWGGAGNDTIVGGAGGDFLYGEAGNDTLNSAGGGDLLDGGKGDDHYDINTDDIIVEAAGNGYDRAVIYNGAVFTLADGVSIEALELWANATCNTIVGNELGQAITGNAGSNILNGGGGADRLTGGAGDDTYVVDTSADRVIEAAGGGSDRVFASSTYYLAAGEEIETLQLLASTGTAKFNIAGNEFRQTLVGNAGANALDGKGGLDVLTGNRGADLFVFSTALGAGNVDRITDFASEDTIRLSKSVFAVLAPGQLASSAFKNITTGVADGNDRILYQQATGELFYDADGSGNGASVKFAVLDNKAALTNADFLIV